MLTNKQRIKLLETMYSQNNTVIVLKEEVRSLKEKLKAIEEHLGIVIENRRFIAVRKEKS